MKSNENTKAIIDEDIYINVLLELVETIAGLPGTSYFESLPDGFESG